MKRTTSLFWTCHCESFPWHRAHEERCTHCGDLRDVHSASGANIAELLHCYGEFLSPDEIGAFERALNPVSNEIWFLVAADGTTIDIRETSHSMLEIEEAYTRRAEELGAPWNENELDYDWSHMDEVCAVYGIDTTNAEVI